jgi:hypothetical protein
VVSLATCHGWVGLPLLGLGMGCAVIVVKEGLMWMPTSMEGEEVAWVVVLWPIEGLLKWDFSTLFPELAWRRRSH